MVLLRRLETDKHDGKLKENEALRNHDQHPVYESLFGRKQVRNTAVGSHRMCHRARYSPPPPSDG